MNFISLNERISDFKMVDLCSHLEDFADFNLHSFHGSEMQLPPQSPSKTIGNLHCSYTEQCSSYIQSANNGVVAQHWLGGGGTASFGEPLENCECYLLYNVPWLFKVVHSLDDALN